MAKTIGDFITENISVYNKLSASGLIPCSTKLYYRIFIKYNDLNDIDRKSDRVTELSNEFNVSFRTIYTALKVMNDPINDNLCKKLTK